MSVSTRSRFIPAISLGFYSLFSLANAADAAIINGNFNDGLNNWNISGDAAEVNSQAVLTTASSSDDDDFFNPANSNILGNDTVEDTATPLELSPIVYNVSGNEVTAIAELEAFLGVAPFALDPTNSFFGAFEGSAIQQTFTANAGDSLDFSWNFLTNEDSNNVSFANDTAFVTLMNTIDSMARVITLADLNSNFNDSTNSFNFNRETGVNTFSQALTPGEYVLGLTVVDDIDSTISSALLVDNVRLTNDNNPNPTSVPEPTTILAFLTTIVLSNKVRASIRDKKQNRSLQKKTRKGVERK